MASSAEEDLRLYTQKSQWSPSKSLPYPDVDFRLSELHQKIHLQLSRRVKFSSHWNTFPITQNSTNFNIYKLKRQNSIF